MPPGDFGPPGWWETRRGWEGACEQAVQTWRSLLGAVGAGLCPRNRRILSGGLYNRIYVLERRFGKKVDSAGRVSHAYPASPHTRHRASEAHSERWGTVGSCLSWSLLSEKLRGAWDRAPATQRGELSGSSSCWFWLLSSLSWVPGSCCLKRLPHQVPVCGF